MFKRNTKNSRLVCLLFVLLSIGIGAHDQALAGRRVPFRNLKPTVILISLDGFRYDYLEKYRAPNLDRLWRAGVRAKWLTPAFPSLTFPSHYSIATGLYAEHHGIVGNRMYDPVFGEAFASNKSENVRDGRWWQGEPIWVTAETQGQRSAAYFFPGTEAAIDAVRPSYWKPYDKTVTNARRVDQVLAWLDLPAAKRPTFIAAYFSDVDTAGHDYSPDSVEVGRAVAEVDRQIGRLVAGLKRRGIYERVNIIIVSDHGMTAIDPSHVVFLDDYFDLSLAAQIVSPAELVNIFPAADAEESIARTLLAKPLAHAACYRKSEIPARFHYREHRRIAPFVCIAEEGWKLTRRELYAEAKRKNEKPKLGAHGYDNQLASMRAIFLAHGAAFKRGAVVEPFENVDVYQIMTSILRLTPAPNDGDARTMQTVLR